jgi:hypothetical protein
MATDKVAYWLDIADEDLGVALSLNAEKCREIIDETKQMQQWIIQKFSPETKPSDSSETTSE